jgi:peptidyl-prolyl cis-trans isomerase SurA
LRVSIRPILGACGVAVALAAAGSAVHAAGPRSTVPRLREPPPAPPTPDVPEASARPTPPGREVADRVVAIIEDEIVTERELTAKVQPFLAQLDDIKDPAKKEQRKKELYRQVLDIEIGEKMVAKEIEKNKDKLGVTEQDIDRAVDERMKYNNMTREQLQAALYGQGMTWAEYRKKLKELLERTRLIQYRVQGKVQVKDADVKRRCEERSRLSAGTSQVCVSHILVAVPPGASAAEVEKKRMEAGRLQSELQNGADFANYALKFSDYKAAPDGKLGCISRGEMEKPFEDAAFALKVGQMSPVVRTSFGFHIIKAYDRITANAGSCDSDTALTPIRNELYEEEMERQMNAFIGELRSKAFVEVKL